MPIMGISNEALTTIGVAVTVISLAWMALVGEAVGPLVWRLWKARRAGQEEEQPVVLPVMREVEPEWSKTLREEITAAREEREKKLEERVERAERAEERVERAERVERVERAEERAKRAEEKAKRAEEREERMEETLEDLRELLLITSEAAVETLHFQQRTELPSSSD